jgi:hypothetical protein
MGPYAVESALGRARRLDPEGSNMIRGTNLSGHGPEANPPRRRDNLGIGRLAPAHERVLQLRTENARQTGRERRGSGSEPVQEWWPQRKGCPGLIWRIQMRAVFRRPEAMRTRWCWRTLSLLAVSVSSQRKQRESNEYEQNNGRRSPGARTQEGLDRRPRRGVTFIRVSVHGVGSARGITIP